MRVYQSEFVIDGDHLGFSVADEGNNLHMMSYNPYSVHSLNGQKLVSLGQLHIGSNVTKMARLKMLHSSEEAPFQQSCILGKSLHCLTLIGSSNGSVSVVAPVSEKLYRRLYSLYSRMVTSLQHVGGLNPRGYR